MLRKLLYVSIAVLCGLATLWGCNDSSDDHNDGIAGRSYVLGGLDGAWPRTSYRFSLRGRGMERPMARY